MSPVIKYDVSDVEAGGGGVQPQPDLYKGTIQNITNRKKNARGEACNDLEVVVSVGEEYANLWTYIQLDNPNTAWKLREFTDAMGLPPKGGFDPAKLKGNPVTVKVVADTDQDGDYRGRIKNLFKPGSDNGASAAGTSSDDEEPWTEEELADLSVDELKAELEALGIKLAGRFSAAKGIAAILEAQETEPEAEPEDEAETGTSVEVDPELAADLSADEADYSEWSDEEIKTFIDDLGIAGNLTGRKTRAKMIAHLVEFAEQVLGDGGSAPDEDAPTDDYDEWPEQDLKDEIATRIEQGATITVAGRKTKDKMIWALREDDKEPF